MKYTEYFGMKAEPFINNLATKDLLQLPGTLSVKERLDYISKGGGVMVQHSTGGFIIRFIKMKGGLK